MRPRLLSLTFVFAVLVLSSRSVYAGHFCITPGSPDGGAAIAEMVFTGEITKVERLEPRTASWDYLVTFKVDTWWKGPQSREVRVLWRTSFMDCDPRDATYSHREDQLNPCEACLRVRAKPSLIKLF